MLTNDLVNRDYGYSGGTAGTSGNTLNGYCQYRLPCGWCKELNKPCPNQCSTTITWNGPSPTATL